MKMINSSIFSILFILGSFTFSAPIEQKLIDPTLFEEIPEEQRDYQDCKIVSNRFQCAGGSPAGYTCQPVRVEDIFEGDDDFFESDNGGPGQLALIRSFILGQDEASAVSGRPTGATCSEERPGFLPTLISRIVLTNKNRQPVHNFSASLITPQITPIVAGQKQYIHHPERDLQTLSLGCLSNLCEKNSSLPVPVEGTPGYNRFSQYQCKARAICRCMEEGERIDLTPGATCCEGLVSANGFCGVDTEVLAATTRNLKFLPDHVDDSTGTFEFLKDPELPEDAESPALVALFNDIIHMKALEWFAYNQTDDNKKCLPDNLALRDIGVKIITPRMQEITAEYNRGMDTILSLKNKYIQYSQQIKDPKAFFKAQGSISYRGKTMTEKQFEVFVRNSTSGAEVFNLMADEQKIQLIYENKVSKLLFDIGEGKDGLSILTEGFAKYRAKEKNIRNIFGQKFECRRTGFLGKRKQLRNRWLSRYRVSGQAGNVALPTEQNQIPTGNFVAFHRPETDDNMNFFAGFMNKTRLGMRIFNLGKAKRGFYLTEPLITGGTEKTYHDFGEHKQSLWSERQKHELSGNKGLESIRSFHKTSISKYFKEQYYDKGYEITDVAFGGLRACVNSTEDNPFQIKTAQACQRYQKAMDLVAEAGYALFLQSSYGGRRYTNATLNSKSDFYRTQQQSAGELAGLYGKMSGIDDELGGLSILDQTGIDFAAKFKEINNNPRYPGNLRLKSYLFFKARAQALLGNVASTGLATGSVPDIGNLYGTPARMLNPNQRPETTTKNLQTKTAELKASNILAAQAARDARNREDFLALSKNGSGGISQSRAERLIAKLNEKAINFQKNNPNAASSIAKAQAVASSANKKLSSVIGSSLAKPAKAPLPSAANNKANSDTKDKKSDIGQSKKTASVSPQPYAPSLATYNNSNNSVYNEKSAAGSSSFKNGQLTSLSDYELGKVIENVENQPHLFKTDQDDSLFSKISKTYARSYDRFLVKKQQNSNQRTKLESKKKSKVKSLLNDI